MDFTATHYVINDFDGVQRKIEVELLFITDGVATVKRRNGRTLKCSESALNKI
jgi:hypothetical protein